MLVMSGPCACFTSIYIQNLPVTHAFAVIWRLVCSFCCPSSASYGVSHFLASHSLRLAPFEAGFCLVVGFPSFSRLSCSFLQSLRFLPHCSAIPTVVLFDPSLLGLFGLVAHSSLNDLVWSFGLFGYVACGLVCPIFLLGIIGSFTFFGPFLPFF